ncbi:hypothetical protein ACFRDV_39940 [Streptomyces fagopyri]|uniref:hypothetical protein n=1 Tax=Streptomyces fagopyri TaxID=2662397 RepID=UPI0036ABB0B0
MATDDEIAFAYTITGIHLGEVMRVFPASVSPFRQPWRSSRRVPCATTDGRRMME